MWMCAQSRGPCLTPGAIKGFSSQTQGELSPFIEEFPIQTSVYRLFSSGIPHGLPWP